MLPHFDEEFVWLQPTHGGVGFEAPLHGRRNPNLKRLFALGRLRGQATGFGGFRGMQPSKHAINDCMQACDSSRLESPLWGPPSERDHARPKAAASAPCTPAKCSRNGTKIESLDGGFGLRKHPAMTSGTKPTLATAFVVVTAGFCFCGRGGARPRYQGVTAFRHHSRRRAAGTNLS